jgi:hypothetical protein
MLRIVGSPAKIGGLEDRIAIAADANSGRKMKSSHHSQATCGSPTWTLAEDFAHVNSSVPVAHKITGCGSMRKLCERYTQSFPKRIELGLSS